MNIKIWGRNIHLAWLFCWTLLFVAIMLCGIFWPTNQFTAIIRLAGIILCLVYVAVYSSQSVWLVMAFATTCVADLILASDNTSAYGIIVFILAQFCHSMYLLKELHYEKRKIFYFYPLVVIMSITLNYSFRFINMLYISCAFYLVLLITNLFLSNYWHKIQPNCPESRYSKWGFLLFFACDSCTVLSYLSLIEVIPINFYALANILVWFFYYPSQILLSNTGKCVIIKKMEGKI